MRLVFLHKVGTEDADMAYLPNEMCEVMLMKIMRTGGEIKAAVRVQVVKKRKTSC